MKDQHKPDADSDDGGKRQQRLPLEWDSTKPSKMSQLTHKKAKSDFSRDDDIPVDKKAVPAEKSEYREKDIPKEKRDKAPALDMKNTDNAITRGDPSASSSGQVQRDNETESRENTIRVRLSNSDVTLGQSLLESRGASNKSIAQVAQTTRIPATFIEAVESDKMENLPPPVYTRSYISQLCRHYGMDSQPMLAEYDRLTKASGHNQEGRRSFVLDHNGEDGRVKYRPAGPEGLDGTRLVDRLSRIAVVGSLALLVLLVLVAFGVQQYRNYQIRRSERIIDEYAPATPAPSSTSLEELIVPQQLPMRELNIPETDS